MEFLSRFGDTNQKCFAIGIPYNSVANLGRGFFNYFSARPMIFLGRGLKIIRYTMIF